MTYNLSILVEPFQDEQGFIEVVVVKTNEHKHLIPKTQIRGM